MQILNKYFCNGAKSYEYYRKYQEKETGRKAVKLPSTSPANAAFFCRETYKSVEGNLCSVTGSTDRIGEVLLDWYDYNARILPWRSEPTPYHVWISEIMLQQTRVEAVKSYYTRFLEELPDIKALAEVPEDRLLKLWEGLGYYNRARNLKAAAQQVMEEYNGVFPDTFEEIKKLKGIGSYTAGAISSFVYHQQKPAVDGNVFSCGYQGFWKTVMTL